MYHREIDAMDTQMYFSLWQGDEAWLIQASSYVVTAYAHTSQVYSTVSMVTGSHEQEISF